MLAFAIALRWMPISRSGAIRPSSGETIEPKSPPCAPNRSYPSRVISSSHARAVRLMPQPVSVVGPENAKPGSEGATMWNASAGSPPWLAGSVNGPTSSRKSYTVLGHPCVISSGVASGTGDLACRKWTFWPSIVVVYCSIAFSLASCARQSYPVRQ
ncbi:hypothetical protein JOD67_005413 [Tenggerimyces flavus]|nr:hypothetical protein [Tenggerimyces flavus]MBM7788733.1 hypothetical protein [Tenggerimyces flavus]